MKAAAQRGNFAARKAVELHDRAVNVIWQIVARFAELCDELPCLFHVAAERIRDDLEAKIPEIVERLAVRLKLHTVSQLQVKNKDIQLPLCRNAGVELAK